MITVYGQPGCGACRATNMYLNNHRVDHLEVDVSVDPSARAFVEQLGYTQLPVVVAGAEHWSGMRPDRLLGLSELCSDLARGNCAAAVDGFCIGGRADGKCHG